MERAELHRAPAGELEGRLALVTGASRGIGLAICRALSAAGARVAMVSRSTDDLLRAADEIGGRAFPRDVCSAEGVAELLEAVRGSLGEPDFLVNSAGAFALAPVSSTPVAVFDRQVDTNLRAPFLLIRALLPAMLERGSGHLVSIGSVAGRVAFAGNGAYAASKFGLRGLHEVLAQETSGTGVRSTLVEPSATDTPLWDPFHPDEEPDLPSRASMLKPEDVARAVAFVLAQPPGVEIPILAIRAAR